MFIHGPSVAAEWKGVCPMKISSVTVLGFLLPLFVSGLSVIWRQLPRRRGPNLLKKKVKSPLTEMRSLVETEAARILACHKEDANAFAGINAIFRDVLSEFDFQQRQIQRFPSLTLEFTRQALDTVAAAIEDLQADYGIQDSSALYRVKQSLEAYVEQLEQEPSSGASRR
jgi:hypothetical protein